MELREPRVPPDSLVCQEQKEKLDDLELEESPADEEKLEPPVAPEPPEPEDSRETLEFPEPPEPLVIEDLMVLPEQRVTLVSPAEVDSLVPVVSLDPPDVPVLMEPREIEVATERMLLPFPDKREMLVCLDEMARRLVHRLLNFSACCVVSQRAKTLH